MAVQATVIIPKAVRSSFRRDSDDEDSDLEHDLRIEEDQIYVLGNASRQKARVQRSAQLAKQAKLAGAPWAKELASFLASEEDLRENTSDTLKAYGHSRHEAEAVIKSIYTRTKKMVENKDNYVSLLLYLASLFIFLGVLWLQRMPSQMFKVEESVRRACLEAAGGLANGEGDLDGLIPTIDGVYDFIEGALIAPTFKDTVCGDGICQRPDEFMSFGRFGCFEDCGQYPQQKMTKVVIALQANFANAKNRSRARWNLVAPEFGDAFSYYANDQTFTRLNETVNRELFLIDGTWRIEIEAWKGAVTGSLTSVDRKGSSTELTTYDTWSACSNSSAELALVNKSALKREVRSIYRPNAAPVCRDSRPAPAPMCDTAVCDVTSCGDIFALAGKDYAQCCGTCAGPASGTFCSPLADDYYPVVEILIPHEVSDCLSSFTSSAAECRQIVDEAETSTCKYRDFLREPPTPVALNTVGGSATWLRDFSCFREDEEECVDESARRLWGESDLTTEWCDPLLIGDGTCDEACNVPKCSMDGGDCTNTASQLTNVCNLKCICDMLGDGTCDPDCDTAGCGFDAGDCCPSLTYETKYVGKSFTLNARKLTTWDPLDSSLPIPMLSRAGSGGSRMRVVGHANRLIGGFLVTQTRVRGDTTCGHWSAQTIPHRFLDLMPTCTVREGRKVNDYTSFGVDPMFVSQSSMYAESVALNMDQYYKKSDDFNLRGLPHGFRNGEVGFPIFFDINLSAERAGLFANYMRQGKYFQNIRASNASSTDETTVRFLTYNGNYKVFCMVTVRFTFDEGGRIFVNLNVSAFDVELFAEPMDFFRLMLEVLFLIILVVQIANEIVEMFTLARGEDKRWSEPFAYCGVIGFRTGSFHFTLNGFWNLFDLFAIAMFITYFISWWIYIIFFANTFAPQLRYEVYSDLGAKGGIFTVNDDGLKDMTGLFDACDKLNAHIQSVAIISVFNIISIILRLFKQLDFQEQFNVVTQTIIQKFSALAHFFVLAVFVMFLFAFAGFLTFGSDIDDFSSYWKSLYSCWLMLLGDPDVPGKLRTLNTPAQNIAFYMYYYMYMGINYFVLLNVLLAIIVEGYTDVASKNRDALSLPVELGRLLRAVVTERVRICRRGRSSDDGTVEERTENRPLSLYEIQRLADKWIDTAAEPRVEKTMHRYPPPGERIVELRLVLETGDTRLILPTRDELKATVLQHFEDIGESPDLPVVTKWVNSVMLYFEEFPDASFLPLEVQEAHERARGTQLRELRKKAVAVVPSSMIEHDEDGVAVPMHIYSEERLDAIHKSASSVAQTLKRRSSASSAEGVGRVAPADANHGIEISTDDE